MSHAMGRLSAALEVPWEVLEYERWVSEQPESAEDYLFAEARARFEARNEDRLRAPVDLRVVEVKGELRLVSERLGGGVSIRGIKRTLAERLLSNIDGARTLAELRFLAGSDRAGFERMLAVGLGSVLFVPEAIADLEHRISGVELVRFVGAPYEIVRAYWENMAAVRRAANEELDQICDREGFVHWLRRLHVLALLGEDLSNFYRPSSRITRRGVRPGQIYTTPTRIVRGERGPLLLSGPRVGVSLMGGAQYHRVLCTNAGDPAALDPERSVVDSAGVPWGELLVGRAPDDTEDTAWFCPPRPLSTQHVQSLYECFQLAVSSARAGDASHAVDTLGRFHHRFVRLHPFRCANQSLSMNLVNLVLARCGIDGIPHLLLDQLALRLQEHAYVRVFRLATEAHSVSGAAEERWSTLREHKSRAYGLIQALQRVKSDSEAGALIDASPQAARSALILAAPPERARPS